MFCRWKAEGVGSVSMILPGKVGMGDFGLASRVEEVETGRGGILWAKGKEWKSTHGMKLGMVGGTVGYYHLAQLDQCRRQGTLRLPFALDVRALSTSLLNVLHSWTDDHRGVQARVGKEPDGACSLPPRLARSLTGQLIRKASVESMTAEEFVVALGLIRGNAGQPRIAPVRVSGPSPTRKSKRRAAGTPCITTVSSLFLPFVL
uniref:Uncharacterized protein n=1 Tax=Chromera velia CCMP2878 TaxID=1169474 RepID=A0A0G4GDM2_9ALVE|eukprot:Cvel_636.t1-p1 / transcript=Cvel_636.t1 / gene=Cvel_636 / organism=Chromera_velia_CCMP2878 / gene_product=hypothetical protein / transcript_product=hypothetical protein / location=Cvel_scaffold19:150269-152234(+) / protein_length=203 / sequence_SO=supercontig / SO=protein_coding / is_pseudo=false